MSPLSPQLLSESDFKRVSEIVHARCGINLHDGKQELVQARIAKMLRHSRFSNASEYIDHVLSDTDSRDFADLIDSLSTNLTSFFRESGHFDYLTDTFLPALFERKKKSGDTRIRAWSAACSTGEEPYTLGIVLKDALDRCGGNFDVKILATDISHRVLAAAKQGVYERRRADPVPPALRGRYMQPTGHQHVEVVPAIRQMIRFAHLNLMENWPFTGPFDFVFCRNVMIYFDKPTQQRLVGRIHDVLAPGGLFFSGHSESLTGISHRFKYVQATIYQKP